jgi:hypothetical protein
MGACWCETWLQAEDRDEAATEFRAIVQQCQWESGHGGYSGTFAEKHEGVAFRDRTFEFVEDARKELEEDAEKWGPALAVKVKDGRGAWFVGAWCSS